MNNLLHKIHSKIVKSNCKTIRTHLSCRILFTTRLPSNLWTRRELPWKIELLSNPRCWSSHSSLTYIWRRFFSSTPAVSRSFTWYVPYFSPLYFLSFASFALTSSRFFVLSLPLSLPLATIPIALFNLCSSLFFSLFPSFRPLASTFSLSSSQLLETCVKRNAEARGGSSN